MVDNTSKVAPLDLRRTAAAIAAAHGAVGAVVMLVMPDGRVKLGTENLTTYKLRDAGCTLIHSANLVDEGELPD